MNPFERKFREFAQNLTAKNAEGNAAHIAAKSGEVFADKPFSVEFQTVYKTAQWGQTVAQVVTYCTTAALGVFALTHIIPLWWGVWVAVPLGLLFAFGVEKVKRSTLAIASKHFLKYKTFGFVGMVAMLTLCVSIAAALYGAKELPGVVYAKPARSIDPAAVLALTADIDQVQSDIDRIQANLRSEKNWVAENRTLPKLQKERAALVEKRDAATNAAQGRGDADHAEALADRAAKVEKMQLYSVGAAIVAELVFLLCTAFVFYYLFRHFAETEQEAKDATTAPTQPATNPAGATLATQPPAHHSNGHYVGTNNGIPIENVTRPPIGFAYANRNAPAHTQTVETQTVHSNQRLCEHCQTSYTHGHARQRYCTEICRVAAWEGRTGKTLKKQRATAA
jgi:hypothetical protein